jgi:hypothetical protein
VGTFDNRSGLVGQRRVELLASALRIGIDRSTAALDL